MSLSAARAQAFFPEIAQHGLVWTVRDDEGYPAPLTSSGNRAMPFWSLQSRVEKIIKNVPAYVSFRPESMAVERWRDHWLPLLRAHDQLVGLNWYGRAATGYNYTPDEVLAWVARIDAGSR